MTGWGRRRGAQLYTTVRRADQHYRDEQAGIRSVHTFSAGGHYDADNVAFGALVGLDEHTLDPAAGFAAHRHRGVTIVTWVLRGALRHTDSTGADVVVTPGTAAVQVAGAGVEHAERNAADAQTRFVQLSLVGGGDEPSYRLSRLPLVVAGTLVDRHRGGRLILEGGRMLVHVLGMTGTAGDLPLAAEDFALAAGDQMRALQEPITIDGDGEALLLLLR